MPKDTIWIIIELKLSEIFLKNLNKAIMAITLLVPLFLGHFFQNYLNVSEFNTVSIVFVLNEQ